MAGVLGLLAVLAAAFLTMARLERRASMQRLHTTKALLLARSGLEDALARLSLMQDSSLQKTAYAGENWDGTPDGFLSSYEARHQVFRITGVNTPADIETCPVQHAMRPSFYARPASAPLSPSTVNLDLIGEVRSLWQFFRDRRPEAYVALVTP